MSGVGGGGGIYIYASGFCRGANFREGWGGATIIFFSKYEQCWYAGHCGFSLRVLPHAGIDFIYCSLLMQSHVFVLKSCCSLYL